MSSIQRIAWPDGRRFAFTIFDDTDLATLANVSPVYDFLTDLGFRTTKSVWPLKGEGEGRFPGATCEDPDYLQWTLELQARGFEIGSHGASYVTSTRERVLEAMDRFRTHYGHYPITLANHAGCAEVIYWGADRFSGGIRLAYQALGMIRGTVVSRGHREGDPLFWGDVCQANVRYVRNFTFTDIDTLEACPQMPYHDPKRPYVRAWWAATEGADIRSFNARLGEANQERLEAQGGACIMYTHLAAGFATGGKLNLQFRRQMEQLARRNGWFVPVGTLLDHLGAIRGEQVLTDSQRRSLELRWLRGKLQTGPT